MSSMDGPFGKKKVCKIQVLIYSKLISEFLDKIWTRWEWALWLIKWFVKVPLSISQISTWFLKSTKKLMKSPYSVIDEKWTFLCPTDQQHYNLWNENIIIIQFLVPLMHVLCPGLNNVIHHRYYKHLASALAYKMSFMCFILYWPKKYTFVQSFGY